MRPKKHSLFALIAILISSLACNLADISNLLEPPTAAPPTPQATAKIIPSETPSPTPIVLKSNIGLPFIEIAMFDQNTGWARTTTGLYRTINGGFNWNQVPIPLVNDGSLLSVTYINANVVYTLYPFPNEKAGIISSTRDGGQTWEQSAAPFEFARLIHVSDTVLFAIEDLGVAAGSHGIAIYQSLDSGKTWQKTFAHVPGETNEASLPFGGQKSLPTFIDPSLGWIGGSQPVENQVFFFRTDDSGRNWIPQTLPVPADIGSYMSNVLPPITFDEDLNNVIVPVDFSLSAGESRRIFFTSADRGQTWLAASPLPHTSAHDFLNPQTGWAWAGKDIYTTSNGGQTWNRLPVSFGPHEEMNQLDFVSYQVGWALTLDNDYRVRLYVTQDGGNTWAALAP